MAEKKAKRFEKTYVQSGFSDSIAIWVDKETGVNYLYIGKAEGAGVTPLLDREGKPVVSLAEFK